MIISLQIISFSLGLALVCHVVFSYENEEKKVLNWFEAAWTGLADSENKISARINRFLHTLLNGLNRLLAYVYGPPLFSSRAFLTAASLCSTITLQWTIVPETVMNVSLVALLIVLLSGVYFGRFHWALYFTACVALLNYEHTYQDALEDVLNLEERVPRFPNEYAVFHYEVMRWMPIGLVISSITDFFIVGIVRKTFQRASQAPTLPRTLLLIALGTIVAPTILVIVVSPAFALESLGVNRQDARELGIVIVWPLLLNIFAVITSLSFLVVLVVAILWRGLYAAMPRILYSVIKLRILENRKVAFGLGVLLIGMAFPDVVPTLGKVAKAVFA